ARAAVPTGSSVRAPRSTRSCARATSRWPNAFPTGTSCSTERNRPTCSRRGRGRSSSSAAKGRCHDGVTPRVIDGNLDVIGAAGPRAFFEPLTAATLWHGYLFTGPQGVGKKTFARELARSLLCVTPKRTLLGWCGVCTGCTRIDAGTHPDFYFTEGQVKIGDRDGGGFHDAEDATARDLVRQLSMHSYAGGKRVFVLGDADFTREAANALRKFFEEPPAHVVLILTANAIGRVLPTIRSRLVEVTFPLLGEDEVVRILERRDIPRDDALRAATVANGSATRALAYLNEGEGATRDAAVEWFFAAAQGGEADASGWAT